MNSAAEDVDVPARRFSFGKREVLRADHDRHEEVAEHGRDGRDQEEEHHHHAVHREQLVVGLVRHEVAGRRRQLEADQHRERAAEEEEERDAGQVEQRDALVVARQQPRLDAVAVVQIVTRRQRCSVWPWLSCLHLRQRLQRLDVLDQLEQLLLADQPLERRHDRLEAGGDLRRRVENRFADVRLVDASPSRRSAASTVLPNRPSQHRAAALRVGPMAGVAGEVREQLLRRPTRAILPARRRSATPGSRSAPSRRPRRSCPSGCVPQYSAQNR